MSGRARPFWSTTGTLSATPAVVYLPDNWKELKLDVTVPSLGQVGASYTAPAVGATNGVTTLTSYGGATSGDFTLIAFPANEIAAETTALTFDESAADVKTALVATNLFATGDITAAGGTLDATPITLTWTAVYAATVPPLILGDNGLLGGTNPIIQVRTTTVADGNGGYAYVSGSEIWTADPLGSRIDRFLYVASVTGSGSFFVSLYR